MAMDGRAREVLVAGTPEDILLHGVRVLRHVGARITRCDPEQGTLEARLTRWRRPALVRLRAVPAPPGTRVSLESDAWGWSLLFRRLRADLGRIEADPS